MGLLLSVMKQTGISRRPKLRAIPKLPQSPPRMMAPYPRAAVERAPVAQIPADSRVGREGESAFVGGEMSSPFAPGLTGIIVSAICGIGVVGKTSSRNGSRAGFRNAFRVFTF